MSLPFAANTVLTASADKRLLVASGCGIRYDEVDGRSALGPESLKEIVALECRPDPASRPTFDGLIPARVGGNDLERALADSVGIREIARGVELSVHLRGRDQTVPLRRFLRRLGIASNDDVSDITVIIELSIQCISGDRVNALPKFDRSIESQPAVRTFVHGVNSTHIGTLGNDVDAALEFEAVGGLIIRAKADSIVVRPCVASVETISTLSYNSNLVSAPTAVLAGCQRRYRSPCLKIRHRPAECLRKQDLPLTPPFISSLSAR